MLVQFADPIEYDGTRFRTRLDRSELQEYIVANWQNFLYERLILDVMPSYPEFKLQVFGRAYAYRAYNA